MPDTSLIWTGAAASAVSAVLWVIEWRAHRAHVRWCTKASRADGVVTRMGILTRPSTDEEDVLSVPIVAFKAADGVMYEINAPDAPHEPGKHVEVSYYPELPSDGRGTKRTPKIGCAAGLLIAGLFLIGWGLTH